MEVADVLIEHAHVVGDQGLEQRTIVINDGRIAALEQPGAPLPQARERFDAGGHLLLPGVVDIHVHFREPGQEYKATYASESSAAAAGGVTTVCDMPNNGEQAITTRARFLRKREVAQASSRVDFGIYAYMVSADPAEVSELAEAGIMGLKWDMSLAGVEVSQGQFLPRPEEALPYFRTAAALGVRIGVHAEDRVLIAARTAALRGAGRMDAAAHVEARPVEAEVNALRQVIELVRASGAQVHIHHLSSAAGLDLVRAAKREGLPLTAETIPAFLFLDAEDYARLGTVLKIHPAVKYREDREALWEGLRDGSIDCVATDHAPHTAEEKRRSVWDASPGAIGVQTSLPLMLDAVSRGLIDLQRCVSVMSSVPARLYRLAPRKGVLRVGADADMVLVDPDQPFTIHNEDMYSPNRLTPFDGRVGHGALLATWLRGAVIARDGKVVGTPRGQWQRPA